MSDRGLCGNFNSSVIIFIQKHINKKLIVSGKKVNIVFFGKKASEIGTVKVDLTLTVFSRSKVTWKSR